MTRREVCAAIGGSLCALRSASGARVPFLRGVNFTAEGPQGYTPAVAGPMLEKLRSYGVDSVALVPYGFTPRDRPFVRFGGGWEREERVESIARLARELKFSVLIKPQIWMHGAFTGDLEFASAADRNAWFADYGAYIESLARMAERTGAELFCVGVEFGKLSRHEQAWRALVTRVRKIYKGAVTYGASQGPEFEGLRFWDALDYIGLNNYYPLTENYSAAAAVSAVEKVRSRFPRPVILTEAGFASYAAPHLRPWDESPRAHSLEDQARAYEAVFRAFYDKPWLAGIYWWKVGTNGYGGRSDGSHTPWGKPAMDVVRRWYSRPRVR